MTHHSEPRSEGDIGNSEVGMLARRIHGWTWQAFPIGMGTGAVFVVLSALQFHQPFLTTIEAIFFFLTISLFLLNVLTLLLQMIFFPRQALRLLRDPVKGIFVPLVVLSFATIIIGTINYAFPQRHVSAELIYGLFWVYIALAVIVSFPMLVIWYNNPHDVKTFTPAWAFLIFPLMFVGVIAFNVLKVLEPSDPRAVGVLLTGYVFQGIGFFMTFFYLCIYILRIMTTGFMDGHQANGAFVACGPPGFTALALLNLGNNARSILTAHDLVSPLAGEIWYATGVVSALLLWGLAVFFFCFGVIPYWFKLHKRLDEILGCWALTFPNVGWINGLRVLGDTFNLRGFHIWHSVMAAFMVMTWVILFVLTIIAFAKGKILIADGAAVMRDWTGEPAGQGSDIEKGHGHHGGHDHDDKHNIQSVPVHLHDHQLHQTVHQYGRF